MKANSDGRMRWGLAQRLFVMTLSVSLAVLAAMAIFSFYSSSAVIREQIDSSISRLNDRTLNYLDMYVESVHSLAMMIVAGGENGSNAQTIQLIKNFSATSYPAARTIYYTDTEGTVFSNRQVYYDIMGNPHLAALTERALGNFGGIAWSQPYHSPVSGDTVSFSCTVKDRQNRSLGVLTIELDLDYIKGDLDRLLHTGAQTYVLMTDEGNVILFNRSSALLEFDHDILRNALSDDMIRELHSMSPGIEDRAFARQQVVVARSPMNRLGWTLFTITDYHQFSSHFQALVQAYVGAGALIMVILLGISFFLSRYFVAPIRSLDKRMRYFTRMQLNEPLPITRSDEIGHLTASYNKMLKRLNDLICEIERTEKEKQQYKIQMLQSQIRPHFLYNTLACISSLAKQNRIREIRTTISAVISLLAYTFDKTDDFVRIQEEIEALDMYVRIQKIRYGDSFDMVLQIDPEAVSLYCPKLTLQPIVENAIFHGIRPCDRRGLIVVRGRVQDQALTITIDDNGIGMDESTFLELLRETGSEQENPDALNHVGIRNVHNRIALSYGMPYGLSLVSKDGPGTCIQILLPVIHNP
jgi:sensor histidine kinase YesM